MYRRIIQLHDIIMPSNVDLQEDESEANSGQEYAFKDGAKIFTTRPRISAKNGLLKGTFFDPETLPPDMNIIVRYEAEPMKRLDFLNFIHRISQKTTTILAIGVDNRIYRLKIRVGLPVFTDLSINAFDWELPIVGYETFWEDVTDRAFYYFKYSIVDGRQFWKYQNELNFYDFNVLNFPLEILDPPANFNASFNNYTKSKVIWDSQSGTISRTGATNAYSISSTDYLINGKSFIFNTSSASNYFQVTLPSGLNIYQFGDLSPFLTGDTIDLAVFVSSTANLTSLTLTLFTNTGVYGVIDLLPFVTTGKFNLIKLSQSMITAVGGFNGIVNYFRITNQDNGTPVTVKVNGIYSAYNIGAGMTYITNNYAFIKNVSGKTEIKAICFFNPSATTKRLTINNKPINLTTDVIALVSENTIYSGTTLNNLKPIGRFSSMIESDIGIQIESDLTATAYYLATNKYI